MKITIKNNATGREIHFLDQDEIKKKYGETKNTLQIEEFILYQDINLYGVGGEGGIFGLPQLESDGYSRNFSQEYNFLGSKYKQRTIELSASIPALVLKENDSVFQYINNVLYQDGTTLSIIIDNTLNNGNKKRVTEASCIASPLTDIAQNFTFIVWGNSAYPFLDEKVIKELNLSNIAGNLIYDKVYPIKYSQETKINYIDIENEAPIPVPLQILFQGGFGTTPRVTNVSNGQYCEYNGIINQNDIIIIDSNNKTMTKNGENDLKEFNGVFLDIPPGVTRFVFSVTDPDPNNLPICYLSFELRSSSV